MRKTGADPKQEETGAKVLDSDEASRRLKLAETARQKGDGEEEEEEEEEDGGDSSNPL